MATTGRVTVRSLSLSVAGVQARGAGSLGDDGRLSDGRMEITAADAAPLAALVPASWHVPAALWQGPLHAVAQLAGAPDALGVRLGVELADARVEAQPVLDLPKQSWAGPLTVRHPGAPRLLGLLGLRAASWVGDGSLSLVAQLSGGPGRLALDTFELGAGSLHASGQLLLRQGPVPEVSGQITAESLPVPLPDWRSTEPLDAALAPAVRVSLRLSAAHVQLGGLPLENVSAGLTAAAGVFRLDDATATLSGGRLTGGLLSGSAMLDMRGAVPLATVRATLAGAAIVEPLTGLPLDLAAGKLNGTVALTATGHSPAAFIATLAGSIGATATDGAVSGFDLSAAGDTLASADPSDSVLTPALSGGSTGFDRLLLAGTVQRGSLTIDDGGLVGPSGRAHLAGTVDIVDHALDLHADLVPAATGLPTLGVRLTGAWSAVRRIPDLAAVTRWRAIEAANQK